MYFLEAMSTSSGDQFGNPGLDAGGAAAVLGSRPPTVGDDPSLSKMAPQNWIDRPAHLQGAGPPPPLLERSDRGGYSTELPDRRRLAHPPPERHRDPP